MQTGKLLAAAAEQTYVLKLVGDVRLTLCCTLDKLFEEIFSSKLQSIVIDLTEAINLDSTTLGLLARVAMKARQEGVSTPTIVSSNSDITQLLHSMGFEQYFVIVSRPIKGFEQLEEIPQLSGSEDHIRHQVLNAHRVLMDMNEHNREAFHSVVQALEACSTPEPHH
ncbi:hypothetical protein BFW38_05530 [Terasakiispira papahanaumokuakeensis]|uniref:STAS domain-containing protein n=1 Tax=Terasakiispira papahanaumokuakeensis TaxID=197479 RepID=A0A1E2VE19_9GAMM|nr:STAS domain-containing protein [Terasakiispira papahanaumokuakeensis]ODC05214.1 hypothetical protein BFW38_05530 [Terasakiispira papahanaumokuakeensis]